MSTRTIRRSLLSIGALVAAACSSASNQSPTPVPDVTLTVVSGGNNVPERYSSDLWVQGNYAYTGTWGSFPRDTSVGNVLNIWFLSSSGAPTLVDSLKTSG